MAQPETIPPALEDVDLAYYLVHSMGRHGDDFREADRRCARQFAHAAAHSSCRRIVYLGGVAPRGRPSEHLASRLEVGEILRASAVPTLELRASMIVGNGSASWQIVRDLAARLPFMVLPRWLESKTCPIALADVIAALRDAREVPLAGSTWFDIPGPDVLRARELLSLAPERCGQGAMVNRNRCDALSITGRREVTRSANPHRRGRPGRGRSLITTKVRSGPQVITRRGVEAAVVVSAADWARLSRRRSPLIEVLRRAPRTPGASMSRVRVTPAARWSCRRGIPARHLCALRVHQARFRRSTP